MASNTQFESICQSRPGNNVNSNIESDQTTAATISAGTDFILDSNGESSSISAFDSSHKWKSNSPTPNRSSGQDNSNSCSLFDKDTISTATNETKEIRKQRLYKKFKRVENLSNRERLSNKRRFNAKLLFHIDIDKFREYIEQSKKSPPPIADGQGKPTFKPTGGHFITKFIHIEKLIDDGDSIIWERIPGNEWDNGIRLS